MTYKRPHPAIGQPYRDKADNLVIELNQLLLENKCPGHFMTNPWISIAHMEKDLIISARCIFHYDPEKKEDIAFFEEYSEEAKDKGVGYKQFYFNILRWFLRKGFPQKL